MEIDGLYKISIIDRQNITVIPYGKAHRVYRYDDISIDSDTIIVYRRKEQYIFHYDSLLELYRLTDILPYDSKKDKEKQKSEDILPRLSKETHQDRIKRFKISYKERIREYFQHNWDDLMAVKRFCKVEGVENIENIRFEIRRMMLYGDHYHINLDDLADILKDFGFEIRGFEREKRTKRANNSWKTAGKWSKKDGKM